MSALTTDPVATRATWKAPTPVRFSGILRSEWIKLRSLRSTVWSYLLVIALAIGMSLLMSMSMVSGMNGGATPSDAAGQAQFLLAPATFGVFFGQLVVGVLGVLVISGEYGTGMIRSTLTAVPRRLPALWGKAIVLGVSTFVVGLVAMVSAFGVVSVIYAPHGISASLLDPDVLLPLLGAALYLALVAVFALGVGTILRSSAGGIAAVLGLILLLPTVLQMIPADWAHDMSPYLLSAAGIAMFGQMSFEAAGFGFWQNLGIVLAWVAVALGGAALLLRRRDA